MTNKITRKVTNTKGARSNGNKHSKDLHKFCDGGDKIVNLKFPTYPNKGKSQKKERKKERKTENNFIFPFHSAAAKNNYIHNLPHISHSYVLVFSLPNYVLANVL